ncbi:MAG: sigma-70 family RNA polymerase sigma factor [Eubacterium sp.]|nr:sigma-70 family RNA polymerase sigma factor [Eubacterium sp.]
MNDLIKRAMRGDAQAFSDLIQQHTQTLYKTARSILRTDADVADAIQETILACWEGLRHLREPRYFRTWMTRILVNKCYDQIRSRSLYAELDEAQEPAQTEVSYENIEWKETLKTIDEKYRLPLMLYYIEGFKTREIAQILDMPEATVRTRLARGRSVVAEQLGYSGRKKEERRAPRVNAIQTQRGDVL